MLICNLQYFGGRGGAATRSVEGMTDESVYEDYFEYENAQLMKEYSRTGRMPSEDINGRKLSRDEKNKLKAEADYISGRAKATDERTLYRGMVMSESEARALNVGDTYTIDSLTSTSTDKSISSIYSNVDNAFGVENPVPVMLTFQSSKGIVGFQPNKETPEVILTKGQQYRVVRNWMDKDGIVHIELYKKGRK